jgi:hypothetical protein
MLTKGKRSLELTSGDPNQVPQRATIARVVRDLLAKEDQITAEESNAGEQFWRS